MHEQVCFGDEAANHPLPIAVAFWIIQVSTEECSSLMQNLIQIHCSTQSFCCDNHTVHMLTQWCLPPPLVSTTKSSLFTYAHSSTLSLAARLYHVSQTVLVILTMVGLFLGNLVHIPHCICWWTWVVFYLLAIVNNAAIDIGILIFVWVPAFTLKKKKPSSGQFY